MEYGYASAKKVILRVTRSVISPIAELPEILHLHDAQVVSVSYT